MLAYDILAAEVTKMPKIIDEAHVFKSVLQVVMKRGYDNATTAEMDNCLMSKPASDITNVTSAGEIRFSPVLDNEVFTDTPDNMMEQGSFQTEVDVVAGVCQVKGYFVNSIIFPHVDFAIINISVFK